MSMNALITLFLVFRAGRRQNIVASARYIQPFVTCAIPAQKWSILHEIEVGLELTYCLRRCSPRAAIMREEEMKTYISAPSRFI